MASAKIQRLAKHLVVDPTSRGYDSMTDAEIATDLMAEQVALGNKTKWTLFGAIDWPEYINQIDAKNDGVGDDADGKRYRAIAYMSFLGGNTGEILPQELYKDIETFTQRSFGNASATLANVKSVLSSDTITRADDLGFAGETHAQLTVRVGKARAAIVTVMLSDSASATAKAKSRGRK